MNQIIFWRVFMYWKSLGSTLLNYGGSLSKLEVSTLCTCHYIYIAFSLHEKFTWNTRFKLSASTQQTLTEHLRYFLYLILQKHSVWLVLPSLVCHQLSLPWSARSAEHRIQQLRHFIFCSFCQTLQTLHQYGDIFLMVRFQVGSFGL